MLSIALALLLQSAAPPAQTPPPGGYQGGGMHGGDRAAMLAGALRQQGMSEDGVTKVIQSIDASMAAAQAGQPAQDRLDAAAAAQPFDAAGFAAALQAQRSATAQQLNADTERQIAVMRTLSPADQQLFAQLLTRSPGPGRGGRGRYGAGGPHGPGGPPPQQ